MGPVGGSLSPRSGSRNWLTGAARRANARPAHPRGRSGTFDEEMRTGNAILDVVVQIVVIAVIAAIVVWILSAVDAPTIIGTIVWILAALAIIVILLQLLRGVGAAGGVGGRHRRP
jgi:hypothetical protein